MMAELAVSDSVTIAFFGSVIVAMSAAIGALWLRLNKCEDDRIAIWREIENLKGKP